MKLTIALTLLLGLTGVNAYGQGPAKRTLKHLTAAQIDPSRLLPPPAPDGSPLQKTEMEEVKQFIKTRTPQRFEQAKWDAEHEDASAFSQVMGPAFDLAKLPATTKLLDAVLNDQAIAASTAKDYFKRKFPVTQASPEKDFAEWSCDAKVRKPGERPLRSYPSGHATLGYSLGVVLAALVPEKAQAILIRAADYAHSREVCGDHYHSDIEASHALGTALGAMLLENASLRPLLNASKNELRAAGLTASRE